MRECIGQWAKELESFVALERGGVRFKDVKNPNEYINVFGHDSSILEIILIRGIDKDPYCFNVYTRVVWSERNPAETPFAFSRYYALDFGSKPKQAFYDDKEYLCEFLDAEQITDKLFGTLPLPTLKLKGHPPSRLDLTPLLKPAATQ